MTFIHRRVIDKNQNLKLDIQTNACKGTSDEVKHLEHVVLYVTTEYSKRGALNIHLTSPSGKSSSKVTNWFIFINNFFFLIHQCHVVTYK